MDRNSFHESLSREIATEKFADFISFSSGDIDPKTYVATEKEYELYEKIANENGLLKNITKDDCAYRESGYWEICFILEAESVLRQMSAESALRKMHKTEIANLIWYADFGSDAFNSALRNKDREVLDQYELEIKLMISGLNKVRGFEGHSVRCDSRSLHKKAHTEEVAGRYIVGEIFQTKSFLSTSVGTNDQYVGQWLDPCSVQLNITNHGAGVLIEEISSRPSEQEILVRPLTKYKVLKKDKKMKSGKLFYEIDLEEMK